MSNWAQYSPPSPVSVCEHVQQEGESISDQTKMETEGEKNIKQHKH